MLKTIISYLNPYLSEGICVAFSGGADSALLLKAACMAREAAEGAPPEILALTVQTRLHPLEDTLEAQTLAQSMGARWMLLPIDEFADPAILDNPKNRCYLCKKLLFSSIKKAAQAQGCLHVFDGTNLDDTREYRPGLRALKELSILSPLMDLGISKAQVRELSAALGLKTAQKPAAPCMATRLPYGARLDYQLLDRIHQGERYLRSLGLNNVRLRFHTPLIRIEVDEKDFSLLINHRKEILQKLHELDFIYITLDLEGFRSGSMDLSMDLIHSPLGVLENRA